MRNAKGENGSSRRDFLRRSAVAAGAAERVRARRACSAEASTDAELSASPQNVTIAGRAGPPLGAPPHQTAPHVHLPTSGICAI